MLEVTTTARLVDYATLEDRGALMASVQRSELESALNSRRWADLWLEIADGDETRRLTVELPADDVEAILGSTGGDEVTFAFDPAAISGLFDPEVEAHGFRGALAIAVVAGAVAAPAGLAASPQTTAAATPQVSSVAAKAQISNLAAGAQVTGAVSSAQVSAAAKPQVSDLAAKAQVKAQFASLYKLKAAGISQLRPH